MRLLPFKEPPLIYYWHKNTKDMLNRSELNALSNRILQQTRPN